MTCLVTNAQRVIETTLKHESKWRRQIMAEANQPPTSQKFWNQEPVKKNDWGPIEYRR